MINLLPPEEKRQIRAARSNSLLFRYNIFSLGALIFLLAAAAVTYLSLTSVQKRSEETISESQARVSQYQDVRVQSEKFKSDLTTAKQILDREVAYTNVILQISRLLPSGITLKQLNLDASTFGTPTTIEVQAKSNDAALKLKESLQSSPLFEDVHFRSITTSTDDKSPYPYSVTMGITIKKEAAKQ